MSNTEKKIIEEHIQQAEVAFSKQEFERSIILLKEIIRENPLYSPAYRKLAAIHLRTKTPQEALPLIQKALDLDKGDPDNWKMLGHYNVLFKLWDKALEAFGQSLKISVENPTIENEILKIYRSMGDKTRLFEKSKELAEKYPDNLLFAQEYAKELYERKEYSEALLWYNNIMDKHPIESLSVALINEWQTLMNKYERSNEVLQWLETQYNAYPKSVMAKWLLGLNYIHTLEYDKAIKVFKEALALNPKDQNVLYSLGYIYYSLGEKKDALVYMMGSLKVNPVQPKALRVASMLHQFTYGDELFTYLNQAGTQLAHMQTDDRAELHNALAHAFENVGELDTAFAHYQEGGRCHAYGQPNPLKDMQGIYMLGKKVDKEYFKSNDGFGSHSSKPVFILGMIRSGTTLTESILSSLDGVYGAGELNYLEQSLDQCKVDGIEIYNSLSTLNNNKASWEERGAYYLSMIEKLAPEGATRIIDKMPDNFKYAGFIPLILPEASIIHTRRHPVEICLSAYRLFFPEGHYWSDDLQTMGKYYRYYHMMMEHWKTLLPEGKILEMKYEDLINDPETESKRLAAHIGIEWNADCLEFHSGNKPIRTASAMQVNQPIYKSSTNRWRKYESYLKPLLNEIGDLVEIYEKELTQIK